MKAEEEEEFFCVFEEDEEEKGLCVLLRERERERDMICFRGLVKCLLLNFCFGKYHCY